MKAAEKQQQIADYKEGLRKKSLDELKKIEQELIADADKLDQEIKETNYDLPAKNYKTACQAIRKLLDKQTVNWQYAMAYIAMYDFWDPDTKPETVAYPMLDSTLRVFGSLEFTGYKEWSYIVAINKYFEPLQDSYTELTEKVYDIAAKHNVIMELMGLSTPIETPQE